MALQADGKLVVAGYFTMVGNPRQAHTNIARLLSDGSVDPDFNATAAGSSVGALALQADGKLVVGGLFGSIDGTTRDNIARLSQPEAALQSLNLTGNTATWLRSGTSPELSLPPQLLFSLDGVTYGSVGTMSRIDGGWSLSGVTLPSAGQNFYLRTRGQLVSGFGNGSQGMIESTRQFYLGDLIFASGFD